jgi:hypothetical protein
MWFAKSNIWGDYVSRSCDLPKRGVLMAYISNLRRVWNEITQKGISFLGNNFPKRNFLFR